MDTIVKNMHKRPPLEVRCRAEYREMPGLQLTVDQAARLFGVNAADCQRLLDALVEGGFLRRRGDTYVRVGVGRDAA